MKLESFEIYVTGPKVSDFHVFCGDKRWALLQRVDVQIAADDFVPKLGVRFPAISLEKGEKPEGADFTILIDERYEHRLCSQIVRVTGKNGEVIGAIKEISIVADVEETNHNIVLKFSELGREFVKEYLDAIPSWVKVEWVE